MQIEDLSDSAHGEEEVLRDAVTRYIQAFYYPTDTDALADIVQASSIFDVYRLTAS